MRVLAMMGADARDAAVVSVIRALASRGLLRLRVAHATDGAVDARALAGHLLAAVGDISGGVVEAEVRPGASDDVAEELLLEAPADLLVIGRSARGAAASGWGENGRTLLRGAGCPVLIVPSDAAPVRLGRVAVGMDLSPQAIDALVLASSLCERPEAVAVIASEDGRDAATVRADLTERLDAALAERGRASVPLRALPGASPADVLLALEDEFDVLAVGSRGLSPLATVFLGSTAERLAGRSRRPILVVRRRGEALGVFGALLGS